jgi:hypothetical protein
MAIPCCVLGDRFPCRPSQFWEGGMLADGRWVKQGHVIRILQALVRAAYTMWHLCTHGSVLFLGFRTQLLPDNTLRVRNCQLPTGWLLPLVMVTTEVWLTGSVYAISIRKCHFGIAGLHPQSPRHFYDNLQHVPLNPRGPPNSVTWLQLLRKQRNTANSTDLTAETHWSTHTRLGALYRLVASDRLVDVTCARSWRLCVIIPAITRWCGAQSVFKVHKKNRVQAPPILLSRTVIGVWYFVVICKRYRSCFLSAQAAADSVNILQLHTFSRLKCELLFFC